MSKHNEKRTERMKRMSDKQLQGVIKSKSLSSAAAQYELSRRSRSGKVAVVQD